MALVPPAPQTLVLFGASGDLTRRKIFPALYGLGRRGLLPEPLAVVGYARTAMDGDGFREYARRAVEEFVAGPIDEAVWKTLADSLSYIAGPFDDEQCFAPLDAGLHAAAERLGTGPGRLYYCATPPSAFPAIVRRLGECGPQTGHRIVIEKPFGTDLASARELNAIVHEVFGESQVFRIDHYLGKETVQNILMFRFGNSMFERVWNRDAIDHVQITVAESVGVGARGAYYEEAGAVRDIVQNHILQVLAVVAMEPPRSLEPEAVRDEKVKVLRALRPLAPADGVRAQYGPGTVGGETVIGYCDEAGVAPNSQVETFVAARALVDNWRWLGVPFYVRTGKRLARRSTEVAVVFREAPGYLFEAAGIAAPPADHLTIRIQPEEGIAFAFQAKEPGPGFSPKTVRMDFAYGDSFQDAPADAYERLLHEAMDADPTLFIREDEVERSWEVVAPLLEDPGPVVEYAAGTFGPPEASALIAPRRWHLG